MKSRFLMRFSAIALFAALALPVSLAAQEHAALHHHYKLIDIGTLGGPNFFVQWSGYPNHVLGTNGTVTGGADSSLVDPLCWNNPDCFLEHAVKWQGGVLKDLGALPGGNDTNDSQAFWINDRGQTVGLSTTGKLDPLLKVPFLHAVLWNAQGTIHDLRTLGGKYSISQAINSQGQVVGTAENAIPDPYNFFDYIIFGISGGTQNRAFLWDPKTRKMRDLGTLKTGNDSSAQYVNDRGQIAGWSYTNATPSNPGTSWCGNNHAVPTTDPFFWDGKMHDIGSLGGNCSIPTGLNKGGQVIGISYLKGDIYTHGFRWDKTGGLKDLLTPGGNYGVAFGINDAGDAVGWAAITGNVPWHAVLWPNGKTTPTDLGVLAGYLYSAANAINSKGQIVGCLTNNANGCTPSVTAAFLWENGDMVDLNTLVPPHTGVQLTGGDDYINEQGEILTSGTLSDGDNHAFLLIPKKTE
jgi:probable HAF family extracellular repeat protein